MNWRNKARMAQLVAKLPAGLSYAAYYFMQRQIGALRAANPTRGLKAGVTIAGLVRTHRGELSGSETFLEVGTGWSVTLPIALWLCGAYRTITVDLNRYLKSELVLEELDYIRTHQETVIELFGPQSTNPVFRERLDLLLASGTNLDRILSMINVQYIAPANAAQLQLPDESIDYHISFMVMQHIRRDLIPGILLEGSRLIKPDGLFIHYTVFSDLFSGVDNSISSVNFLQFTEAEWEAIAGNRYMYHNRLRVDELQQLFERSGLTVLQLDTKIDSAGIRALESGQLSLADRFRDKAIETNATASAWVTATKV